MAYPGSAVHPGASLYPAAGGGGGTPNEGSASGSFAWAGAAAGVAVVPFLTAQPSAIVALGDSTGDDNDEWFRLLADRVAAAWPDSTVVFRTYNSGTTSYGSPVTVWNGGGSTTTIYNGHVGGIAADYPDGAGGRLAAMVPADPDVVILNFGHNHTSESSAVFEGKLDALVAAVQALYASTPIVVSSQNQQKSPATYRVEHNVRQAHLANYAAAHGYGYIGAYEAFLSAATPDSFVQADGVHPTVTGTGDGSHLWADAARSFLLPAAAAILGATPIDGLRLGSVAVSRAYLGSTRVR